jgi:hypothetical protein
MMKSFVMDAIFPPTTYDAGSWKGASSAVKKWVRTAAETLTTAPSKLTTNLASKVTVRGLSSKSVHGFEHGIKPKMLAEPRQFGNEQWILRRTNKYRSGRG